MGGSKKDPMMSEYPPGQGPPDVMDEQPVGGGGGKNPFGAENEQPPP